MDFYQTGSRNDLARLVDNGGKIVDAHHFGLHDRDRLDLVKMATMPEHAVDGKRVDVSGAA